MPGNFTTHLDFTFEKPEGHTALNVRTMLEEAARVDPDDLFLLYEHGQLTYAQFNALVDIAASAWYEFGVKKGDRVAFMLENRVEFLQCWLGLAKIGAILVAVNTRWQQDEVRYMLSLTEPRFALVGEAHRDVFQAARSGSSSIEQQFTLGDDDRFVNLSHALATTTGDPPEAELVATDDISFISTSGTTGRPKAVMQTHGNYVLTGEGYASWVELQPRERIYLCLPLFHINSQTYTVMGAIAARATIVLVERFSASRFWSDMNQFGVNVFNYIGSMLVALSKREPVAEERTHQVRLTYGGPAVDASAREALEQRFGFTIISGIGMSETTYGLIEPLHEQRRSGSLGRPRQHPFRHFLNEARVVDDAGNEVASGEVGELIFRSPVQMKGYYRNPAQTAATIRDGWLFTGDLVRMDSDGFFYFVDRKKDIIRVKGENVASSEVEGVLNGHPSVLEAAVVAVPSEMTDEDIAAFLVLRPNAAARSDDITEWCRSQLAAFKVPRHIWFVTALPKTETLRVEKHRLRDMATRKLAEADGSTL